ncbi:hypothetical protein [Streptomyces sp. CA-146814]|uniref:hypothetical protein n=1 Tax=Streptomyces sp. CA-146814 TaxID=3240053 RepID=UPI003D92ED66
MSKLVTGAIVLASAILIGGTALTASASNSDIPPAPPRPEWVKPDGSVDKSKIPDSFPVMGSDGKPVLDENGNEVRERNDFHPDAPSGRSGDEGRVKKRWVEVDENGNKVEVAEVEPVSPVGQ